MPATTAATTSTLVSITTDTPRWRRWLTWCLGSAGLAAVALCTLAWTQARAQQASAPAMPPGQWVAVQGARRLHLHCMGQGEPTVLLEAGMSGGASDWAWVQPAIARGARACAYDRAGYGWSDPMPAGAPRTPHADFEQLLAHSGLRQPLVLVGHSLGGLLVADFARAHPQQVAGLVLVDAVHRQQDAADDPAVLSGAYAAQRRDLGRLTKFGAAVAPTGLLRLFGLGASLVAHRLPPPQRDAAVAQSWRSDSYRALSDENAQFESWLERSRALGPLPKVPTVLLRSTAPRDFPPGMEGSELQALWAARQQALASEAGVAAEPVDGSGHYLHVDQPQSVIEAVQRVLALARATR